MKYLEEKIVKILMLLSIGIVAFFVLSVLWTIFKRGFPVLSWEMVSQLPSGGFYLGGKGGFLNAIVGSLYIVGRFYLARTAYLAARGILYECVSRNPIPNSDMLPVWLTIPSLEFRASYMAPLPSP